MQKGIQLVKDIGPAPAIIESDSLNVVSLISDKIASCCEVRWLISEIQEILSSFESSFKVIFTPRSHNGAAHHLAKSTLM